MSGGFLNWDGVGCSSDGSSVLNDTWHLCGLGFLVEVNSCSIV